MNLGRSIETGAVLLAGLGLFGEAQASNYQVFTEGTHTRLVDVDADGVHVLTCKVNRVQKEGEWEGCLFWTEGSPMPTVNTGAEAGRKEYTLGTGDEFYVGTGTGNNFWQKAICDGNKVVPEKPDNCRVSPAGARAPGSGDVYNRRVKQMSARFSNR